MLWVALCLALTYSSVAFAQSKTYTFAVPIQDVGSFANYASVPIGFETLPVKNKLTGEITGVFNSEQRERNISLGTFKFDAVDNAESAILVEQVHKTYDIQNGDLATFELTLYDIKNANIFFDLARYYVGLQTVYDKPLYSISKALDLSNPSKEAVLLEALLKETKFVAGAMREQMKSPDVNEGRFKGMDLFTAMENSDVHDLKCFLEYIVEHPKKYMGQQWKFSEIYATWIDSGCPTTARPLLENLEAVNDKKFNQLVKSVEPLRMKIMIEEWRSEVSNEKDAENYGLAISLLDVCQKAAMTIEDMDQLAWCYFNRSEILEDQEKYDEAILQLTNAIDLFEDAENKGAMLSVYNNMGNLLNKVGEYKNAINFLNKAYAINEPLLKKNKQVLNGVAALIKRNLGDSYTGLSSYKKALKSYEKALELLEFASTQRLIKRKATVYYKMGELYQKMDKPKKGAEYEEKAIELYKTILGDDASKS